jgi:hypothetical protein
MRIRKECKKKIVSMLANGVLVLSILAVLLPLSMPTAEATIYVIWDDWDVITPESYKDDTFILYGNLTIDGGSLTLNNCNLEMTYAGNVTGNVIWVYDSDPNHDD